MKMKLSYIIISLIIFSCSNQSHQENLNNELVEKNNPDQYSESVDSTDSIIHYVRAHRSLEVKNLSFAEARFKKVVELEPNFARGWLGLGEVSILKNNFENASSHLDRALELKPDLYEAIYLKGVAKNFQNNCEEKGIVFYWFIGLDRHLAKFASRNRTTLSSHQQSLE